MHASFVDALFVDRRPLIWLLHVVGSYFASDAERFVASRDILKRSITIDAEGLGEAHPDALTSMSNLAATLWYSGDRLAALSLMTAVVRGVLSIAEIFVVSASLRGAHA